MEYFCWATGCINMGLSLAFQAYGHHSKALEKTAYKEGFLRATNVHQIASLGFILLSFKGASIPMTLMLSTATFLFPFVVYYQAIFNQGQRVMLSSLVPKGGALHIIFWINFGLFYFSSNTMQQIGSVTHSYLDSDYQKSNKIE